MTEEEKKRTVRVTNIQRFCLHDGPGVRTTVFFKGCSIYCPWCCNPEKISYDFQPWHDSDGTSGVYGYDITLGELLGEIKKDAVFYIDGGGVTLSGGEPLLQIERCVPLLMELKNAGISIAVETALFVDESAVMTALEYVDWWYVDMKLLVPEMCKDVLGGNADIYKSNLSLVVRAASKLHIRIPCHYYVANGENIKSIVNILHDNAINEVELLEIHELGKKKYHALGKEIRDDKEKNIGAIDVIYRNLIKEKINCIKNQV